MSRGFGAMQRTILKTMEAAMRYELHNGALATPYTTLSFLETKHPPGPFPIIGGYRQLGGREGGIIIHGDLAATTGETRVCSFCPVLW
jgi:hypothetical protein